MTRNYTFSGHFWEHQDYNGVITLVNRMRMGKQTCEKLKAGYELRMSMEENHAATLLQMANNLQTCEETGQLGQLLNTTQEQWTLLANTHLQTAQDLNSNVILPLSNLLIKQKQQRRELQANVTKFYNNRQLQTLCVLRARDRYNAECTKANKSMQQSSGKEKHLTYKRANAAIKKFQQAYDDSMEDLKMVTEEWNKQWKYTCQEFECLEKERMVFIQNNTYTCNDLLSKISDSSAQAYEKIERAVDMVDVDADLDDFVHKNGGIDTIPDAMDYIKLYVLQVATKPLENDENQHDTAIATDTISHTSMVKDNESYSTLEANDETTLDNIDSNSNATSLIVGRMEMYNSDDDNFTSSDDDGDYDDFGYGYEHDKSLDDGTTEYRYDASQYYTHDNDWHQQDERVENHDDMTSNSSHYQHSEHYHDYGYHQKDLTQHGDDAPPANLRNIDTNDGSVMEGTEGKAPLEGLDIDATHEKLSRDDMNNALENYDEEQRDQTSTQQHKNHGVNSLTTDGNWATGMVDQNSTIVQVQHQNTDTAAKQKSRYQPPAINTQYQPSATRYDIRHQQRPPPPLPEHQFDPTQSMELANDNTSLASTPASPSSNTVNEELDSMLRQLEQQTVTRSNNFTVEPRLLTKKQPTAGRVRLSGVRPRALKTKPGQKSLKEMAGINTTSATNDSSRQNDSNIGDDSTAPSTSTIVAGSDDTPPLSNSLASRKGLFDPFSSLATMSSNSLSIANTTPSAAQVKRQQQKQQKWMLDEVTRAMRQNTNNTKQRPLPERPMDSTSNTN